jgi:ubiquinone/menaquinone biosynthesis C-methylase UbiE
VSLLGRLKDILGPHKAASDDRRSEIVRDPGAPVGFHSAQDVKQYYDETTEQYIAGFGDVFQAIRPDSTEFLLKYISGAAGLKDGMDVLDAGCGVCGPAIWFAKHFDIRIEALTISPVQVETSKRRIAEAGIGDKINVALGDFHDLAKIFPHHSFDRVLFLETICHARDYRPVLDGAKKLIRRSGGLYIKDYHAVDNRSRPHLIPAQTHDLEESYRLYRSVFPRISELIDLMGELGYILAYARNPEFEQSPEPFWRFERISGLDWTKMLQTPDVAMVIQPLELYAMVL